VKLSVTADALKIACHFFFWILKLDFCFFDHWKSTCNWSVSCYPFWHYFRGNFRSHSKRYGIFYPFLSLSFENPFISSRIIVSENDKHKNSPENKNKILARGSDEHSRWQWLVNGTEIMEQISSNLLCCLLEIYTHHVTIIKMYEANRR
jgi:hypothetical protein